MRTFPDNRHVRQGRICIAEVVLLGMDIWGEVVAHEREEGCDGESLVAVAHELEVDRVPVVPELKKGGGGVDGDHEENADDLTLLARLGVVDGVHEDEVEGEAYCDDGAGAGDD